MSSNQITSSLSGKMTDKFLENARNGRLPDIRSAIEQKMDVNTTNKVFTLLVERIIDNKGKQTLPPKYSYLNEISEKMNKFSSEYRVLSLPDGLEENKTQETLNDYVYRKTKAADVKTFIDKVAKNKKTPTYDNTEFLYAGVVELNNDDAKFSNVNCSRFIFILIKTPSNCWA